MATLLLFVTGCSMAVRGSGEPEFGEGYVSRREALHISIVQLIINGEAFIDKEVIIAGVFQWQNDI